MAIEEEGIRVTIDAELSRFEQNMNRAGRTVETQTEKMDRSTKRAARSFGTLEGRLDPAARALQRYERDTAKVQRALDKGAVSSERAAAVQRRLNDQYEQAIARTRQLSMSQQGFGRSTAQMATQVERGSRRLSAATSRQRNFGMATQNAAFQVGDFATQIASGQSATRALAQQLPQLLGGMGILGAVIGGVVAVAGALVPILLDTASAADKASEASDALSDAQDVVNTTMAAGVDDAEDLRRKYVELTEAGRSLERLQINAALREIDRALASQRDAISSQLDELEGRRTIIENLLQQGIDRQRVSGFTNLFNAIDEFRDGGSAQDLVESLTEITQQFDEGTGEFLKLVDGLLENVTSMADLRDRADELRDALEQLDETQGQTSQSAEDLEKAQERLNKAVIRSTDAAYEFRRNQEQQVADLKRQVAQTERLVAALRASGDEYERVKDNVDLLNAARKANIELSTDEGQAWAEQYQRLQDSNEQLERMRETSEDATDASRKLGAEFDSTSEILVGGAREAGRAIQSALADALLGVEGSLIEGARRIAANIAAQFATQRIIMPVALGAVGMGGGASGAAASGGGGLGNTALSLGGQALDLTGFGSSITSGINSFGTSIGFGSGLSTSAAQAGGLTPMAASSGLPSSTGALTTASLSGVLGAAGLGALGGGLIGPYIGGSATGGSVGGGLGAAAGAAIGSVIPGIGTVVGGLIGGVLGGAGGSFFGGSTPSRAINRRFGVRNGRLSLVDGGSDEASEEQREAFERLSSSLTQQVNQFLDSIGAELRNVPRSIISQTRREGIRAAVGGDIANNRAHRQFGDLQSAAQFVAQGVLQQADFAGLSSFVERAVKRSLDIRGGDLQQTQVDVQLARQIEAVRDQQRFGETELAIRQVRDRFGEMIKRARELRIGTDELIEARNEEIQAIRQQARAQELQARAQELQAEIGVRQNVGAAAGRLRSFLDQQQISDTSTADPLERVQAAQAQFSGRLQDVRGGDLGAVDPLLQSAQSLLDIGRQTFASSPDFAGIERFVRSNLQSVGEQITSTQFVGDQISDAIAQQTETQVEQFDRLEASNDELRREIRDLRRALEDAA